MFYKKVLRPLLFKVYAERVHHWIRHLLKVGMAIPGVKGITRAYYRVEAPELEQQLFGLHFKNPIGIAAGFDKNAEMYADLEALGFGFVEIGTVTPLPQDGNPKPRLFRLPKDKAVINRMGFNNQGAERIAQRLSRRKPSPMIVGGNLGKNTLTPNEDAPADYLKVFEALFDKVDYFVVNVSCPNVSQLCALQDQDALEAILMALQDANQAKAQPKPILLKIAPDLNDRQLDEVIDIVANTKIQGVIATNTTVSRDGLQTNTNDIGMGGLSGAPLKDKSTHVIRYLAQKSNKAFPIIGVGGIFSAQDAIEKLDAGADLLQVYTGFIYEGPALAKKLNKAILAHWRGRRGANN